MTNKIKRIYSLKNKEALIFKGKDGGEQYGCFQVNFKGDFQIKAGCGPVSFSNFLIYMMRQGRIELPYKTDTLDERLELMNEAWSCITPGNMGVKNVEMYYEGAKGFSDKYNLGLSFKFIRVPSKIFKFNGRNDIVDMIKESLEDDRPMSFLNLINRKGEKPDNWHWVTIVSMIETEDSRYIIEVYDGDERFEVDIDNWLKDRVMGGTFLSIYV